MSEKDLPAKLVDGEAVIQLTDEQAAYIETLIERDQFFYGDRKNGGHRSDVPHLYILNINRKNIQESKEPRQAATMDVDTLRYFLIACLDRMFCSRMIRQGRYIQAYTLHYEQSYTCLHMF